MLDESCEDTKNILSYLTPVFVISMDLQILNQLKPYVLDFTRFKILQGNLGTANKFRSLNAFIIENSYCQVLR